MNIWLIWLTVAGILLIAEMMTSSFYLLLAALGALAASLLAYMGVNDTAQILTATIVTLIGWSLLFKFGSQSKRGHSENNKDMNMDIGAVVRIADIAPDGKLRVNYRGSTWQAELSDRHSLPSLDTPYIISGISGSTLILTPKGQ